LAQTAIEEGRVYVDGKSNLKAAVAIKPGDKIVVALGPKHRWLTVVDLGTRRGPAPEAQALYREETGEA
jgi:ribosome-associated heat shock protein Hsp15